MHLTFIHPDALWLLLLIPLLLGLALAVPRRIAKARFWSSLALRTAIFLSLILALAGTQIVRAIGATTTIFLIDGSDSIALTQRARAESFVQQALTAMPPDDRAGVVVFGRDALVERPPAADLTLGQVTAQPFSGETNLEAALQLGLAMQPGEGHQRLVLLSDGGENLGSAQAAAQIAASRGIPIDVVPLTGVADGLDAQISSVSMPAAAREGQKLTMKIGLETSAVTRGRLTVTGPGGTVIVSQDVAVPPAGASYELTLPAPQPAFNRYVARLEVVGDARPENNTAEAYTYVRGQPRVLLIEGTPAAARNLANALGTAAVVEIAAPDAAPTSIGALSAYDAVALVDVPKHALTDRTQSALAAYVHDLGRGLLMVGGTQSFGPGGWRKTPIEAALPVSMDIPTHYQIPPVSIVVLIDTSGSMSEQAGGRTKLQLAADGAAQVAALMRDTDELTVIPFDEAPGKIVGPIPGNRRAEAIKQLGTIAPGGGGITFHDGMLAAEKAINTSTNGVKHIITITDGDDTEQHEGALEIVQRLRAQHVTLTSIAVGDGADVPFIKSAVDAGGGRFFLTRSATDIPSLLTDEAQAVLESYIVEEPFTPTQTAIHPILRGIERVPQLQGHVVTTAKQTAQVLLATPRGEPVLASWQYGLGHALAWTSDMRGQWAADWVTWNQFPRFATQLVTWLLPAPDSQLLTLDPQTVNGQLVLDVQARDAQARPRTGMTVTGQLLRGDGVATDVALREVAPGVYRAAVIDAQPGAYLAQVIARDGQGNVVGAVGSGVVVPRSAEYRTRGANLGLLAALAKQSGGRESIVPKQAFDPNLASRGSVSEIALPLLALALLLLPLDIGVRRVFGMRRTFAGGSRRPTPPLQPALLRERAATPLEGQQPAGAKPRPAITAQSAGIERLREAQERARKRARGEEDA